MVELFANSGDPDQMPHSAASDLGLHCLPFIFLGVSRLQWVNLVSVEALGSRGLFLVYHMLFFLPLTQEQLSLTKILLTGLLNLDWNKQMFKCTHKIHLGA